MLCPPKWHGTDYPISHEHGEGLQENNVFRGAFLQTSFDSIVSNDASVFVYWCLRYHVWDCGDILVRENVISMTSGSNERIAEQIHNIAVWHHLTHIILYGVVPTNMKNTHKMENVSEKAKGNLGFPILTRPNLQNVGLSFYIFLWSSNNYEIRMQMVFCSRRVQTKYVE